MRILSFCICENKNADQLRGNREADQRLCFRYKDRTKRAKYVRKTRLPLWHVIGLIWKVQFLKRVRFRHSF